MITRQRTGRLEVYDPRVCKIADRRGSLQVVHKFMILPVLPFLFMHSVFLFRQ